MKSYYVIYNKKDHGYLKLKSFEKHAVSKEINHLNLFSKLGVKKRLNLVGQEDLEVLKVVLYTSQLSESVLNDILGE